MSWPPFIHGYTPADLQNMGMTGLLLRRRNPNLNTSDQCCSAPSAASGFKPRFRSKISRLPEPIQTNLNAMLAEGRSYAEIIRWLHDSGYLGFNKVNLHNWRQTSPAFRTTRPGAKPLSQKRSDRSLT